jgi:glutamyl-tRNA reductase
MELVLVGLNHKTAPIDIREKVAFREETIPEALRRLCRDFGFDEALIVSTCNRVELVANGSRNGVSATQLREFLCRHHEVEASLLNGHLYTHRDDELVRHIFRVASSLDSMVPGEAQILGQLKQAFTRALEAGVVGDSLRRLMPHAFYVAKRIRRETRVGRSPVSISSVAVELAVKIFGELTGKSVLLLGAGKMSELAARNLIRSGAGDIRVANRTPEKAREMAQRFGGRVLSFDRLEDSIAESDIVIVSTGADGFLVSRELLERVMRRRHFDPLFLIDISVPRNVDPSVNEIETAFCYDVDDLQSVVEVNLEGRHQEAEWAEQIIGEEVRSFTLGCRRRGLGPVVQSFRRRLEAICLEELEKDRDSFSAEDYRRFERIMLRAAHRIAHPLLVQMKKDQKGSGEGSEAVRIVAEAFEIDRSE